MLTATKAKVTPGKLLIDGKWSEGSGKSFDTFNPATGEVLTQVAEGGASGVDQAVAAARKAFDDVNGAWRKIEVRVSKPGLLARTRRGYYGPAGQ